MKKILAILIAFAALPSFAFAINYNIQVFMVGGGGAGASHAGGGGGAGGYVSSSTHTMVAGSYPVVIGAGGIGTNTGIYGQNGSSTTFDGFTAQGGGGGAGNNASPLTGRDGGSGGGGAGDSAATTSGGSGTAGQGNNGGGNGGATTSPYPSGGGGGAGSAGSNAANVGIGGNGGNGTSTTIRGTSECYAGGGGGAPFYQNQGAGGSATCGGAPGRRDVPGQNASSSSGGGGGGSYNLTGGGNGGNGGSGIAIFRFTTGLFNFTGGVSSTVASDTVVTFTASGTFVISDIVFPHINLSTSTYSFSSSATSSTETITNDGQADTTLDWTVTSTQPWLTFSAQSGSLNQNVTTSVSFISNGWGYTAGIYNATATISDSKGTATNTPQYANVTMTVAAAGGAATGTRSWWWTN